jgi:hypothetical protein
MKEKSNENPCKGSKYHDFAKSGIRIEAGIIIKKCFNCGLTSKSKVSIEKSNR